MCVTTSPDSRFGALRDIRVIDLTQMLAGPFGTRMLADHGADVIKVEPFAGDTTRSWGPFRPDDQERALGGYFQSISRNKKSVCLDLKTESGREALKALVRDADALVENFRTGVMERLGLGYEVLISINPRLVYGALRGFGDPRTGASPCADWPAFDVVAQAMGGMMAITGSDAATPTKVGPGVGDIIPGMMLAFGVLAAINHARRTGEGQFVDIAMVDAVLAVCERTVWQRSVLGETPGPEGDHHPFLCPFGKFPALDGFITLAAPQDVFFQALCESLGAKELISDPRFSCASKRSENRQHLIPELSAHIRKSGKAHLTQVLGGRIPFGPVTNIADIEDHPHFAARQMIVDVEQPGSMPLHVAGVPIKMTVTPGGVKGRAPFLGESTRVQLRRTGFSDVEVDDLIKNRAAFSHEKGS